MVLRKVKRAVLPWTSRVKCRRCRLPNWQPHPLLWFTFVFLGILLLYRTLLDHPPGIHVRCACGELQATQERVSRYLPSLMSEVDILTNRTAVQEIQRSHPSLAIHFLVEVEERGHRCSTTPSLFSIRYTNLVWQESKVREATFLVYAAYWDEREDAGPVVRVLTMTDTPSPPTPYCLFHTHAHMPPTSTRATRLDYIHWQEEIPGEWLPYLVTCVAGPGAVVPRAVSLVENQCTKPTNAMRVHHHHHHGPAGTNDPPQPAHGKDNSPARKKDNLSPQSRSRSHPHSDKSLRTPSGDKKLVSGDVMLANTPRAYGNESGGGIVDERKDIKVDHKLHSSKAEDAVSSNLFRGQSTQDEENQEKRSKTEVNQDNPKIPKKNIALCHKFLFNPTRDFSTKLVEWIEAAKAWGVDGITFYLAAVHPSVMKVLHHYQTRGDITLHLWASPGHLPSLPHLYRALFDTQRYVMFTSENIPYTDCLLRHINTHRYVAVWDMDEVILPATQFSSLVDMVEAAKTRATYQGLEPVSYLARCAYYFDDLVEPSSPSLPGYVNLLRHVTRTVKFTPPAVFTKSIHDTQYALGLHAHFALVSLRGKLDRNRDLYHLYPGSEGHLAHYRSQCQGEDQTVCELDYRPYLIRDITMWRHRDRILAKTTEVLLHLGLIHDEPQRRIH